MPNRHLIQLDTFAIADINVARFVISLLMALIVLLLNLGTSHPANHVYIVLDAFRVFKTHYVALSLEITISF